MISQAEIYPLADGGVLLCFGDDTRRLEIEIDTDGDATAISQGEIVAPDELAEWFGIVVPDD